MKKYKLIKTYPGSPVLNTEVIKNGTGYDRIDKSQSLKNWVIPVNIEHYTEFWEEVIELPEYVKCIWNNGVDYGTNGVGRFFKVIGENRPNGSDYILVYDGKALPSAFKKRFTPATKEEYDNQFKDYEILSFISTLDNPGKQPVYKHADGLFAIKDSIKGYNPESCYLTEYFQIHSVKRLSDGEVFQIGDKVDSTISDLGRAADLTRIKLENNKLLFGLRDLGFYPLSTLLKPKPPLLTTEDGVDVFEGDSVYCAGNRDGYLFQKPIKVIEFTRSRKHLIDFSTLKAAETYLVLNKPCLSYNDVIKTLYGNTQATNCLSLLAVIKSRLGIKP